MLTTNCFVLKYSIFEGEIAMKTPLWNSSHSIWLIILINNDGKSRFDEKSFFQILNFTVFFNNGVMVFLIMRKQRFMKIKIGAYGNFVCKNNNNTHTSECRILSCVYNHQWAHLASLMVSFCFFFGEDEIELGGLQWNWLRYTDGSYNSIYC